MELRVVRRRMIWNRRLAFGADELRSKPLIEQANPRSGKSRAATNIDLLDPVVDIKLHP